MQTPVDYLDRFTNLSVFDADVGEWISGLAVDRYRLGAQQPYIDERLRLARKVKKDLAVRRRTDPDAVIEITVETASGVEQTTFDDLTFEGDDQLWALLRYPYVGKGSPEAIQVACQLAIRDVPGSPPLVASAGLQAYCDKWLGLDCNGFVGNFLRHVVAAVPWTDVNRDASIEANNLITDMFATYGGVARNAAAEINPDELNLLALVDDSGRVIKGGGAPYGHIMISGPGERDEVFDLKSTFGVPNESGVPAICVAESTGAIDPDDGRTGLVRSFYAYVDKPGQPGVFRVRRGFNGKVINVRVKGASWNR